MTPEEFGEIVIRATSDGQVLRLKDVADIELGQESYAYHGLVNGYPGVSALVFQTAGTNATQTVEEIDALLAEVSKDLPKGIEIRPLMSVNDYLYASIHEVIKTLIGGHHPRRTGGLCLPAGYTLDADSRPSRSSYRWSVRSPSFRSRASRSTC